MFGVVTPKSGKVVSTSPKEKEGASMACIVFSKDCIAAVARLIPLISTPAFIADCTFSIAIVPAFAALTISIIGSEKLSYSSIEVLIEAI